jgi:hypothetical protein
MIAAAALTVFYRSDKSLTIEPTGTLFYVDGRQGRFTSVISRGIVQAVIQQSPNVTSRDLLVDRLGERQFPRYVSMARVDFRNAGLMVDVLTSVRGTGYRLVDGWSLQEAERPALARAMGELSTLVADAIAFVDRSKLETNKIGLIQVARGGFRSLVSGQNFLRFDQTICQILDELSSMGLDTRYMRDIVKVKQALIELASYLLFWRTGDRLTDDDWKTNFRQESQSLLDEIAYDIKRLAASGRRGMT